MFKTFESVQDFLDNLGMFHVDLSLDRMTAALATLGLNGAKKPENSEGSRTLPFIVQVLGTNGKGSTSTFLARLAAAHGLRTGLYTSPHFVTPRERVRLFCDTAIHPGGIGLGTELLSAEDWPALANQVHSAAPELTYFEFLTVLGILAFAEQKLDFVVMEAGLGGRHDATTAVPAHGVIFAPIDLDHTKVLGDTIALIADDKAAAMRETAFALTGPQPAEAMTVLNHVAAGKGVTLQHADHLAALPHTPLGLAGPHQRENARLAVAAWTLVASQLHIPVREEAVAQGLAAARLPGRFQHVPASNGEAAFILDGGHNPHGLRACAAALREANIHPAALIFSCLGDKDVDALLPLVRDMAGAATIFTPTIQDNERAMSGEELAGRLVALGARAVPMPRLATALHEAERLVAATAPHPVESPVLVCGSLYLLGEFYTLRPQWL